MGANIGVRNSRGEIPLSRILPETLEEFLNHCSNHENHPLHQDFKVNLQLLYLKKHSKLLGFKETVWENLTHFY